uniref:uncharacterized protein LOC100186160 isoform X2 n=1 Tax=Ciona intestinalis TaxID=7719 RepID=UPI000EF5096A|nr:uncharacterized protein LOC100186160 isoform X2 [Ciona intestinalis]|eukprot:XP_026691231.1 uncharacterized protein LOC100186160 isoform X2 [Ciona intestinalis]
MVTGSRSATTTSSKLRKTFDPGLGFQYSFNANRTFSRSGRRPVSSPARIKQSTPNKNDKYVSPEDAIAMAQSPTPTFIRETLGDSLIMLQRGYEKVNPTKFTNLTKIMSKRPTDVPLTSPRQELSSPRLVRQINKRVRSGNYRAVMVNAAQQTSAEGSRPTTKNAWGKRSIDVVLPRSSDSLPDEKSSWVSSKAKSSLGSYTMTEDRCVRCTEVPDIQIEGRMLTNKNTLMAREHCEILGAESCPDCLKTKNRKHHERHCVNSTPSLPTDVYKMALVHEKAPHLTMRQVRRKILEGEISDNVAPLMYWPPPEENVLAEFNRNVETDLGSNTNEQNISSLSLGSEPKKISRSKSRRLLSGFEAIQETTENENDVDVLAVVAKSNNEDDFNETDTDAPHNMIYKRHDAVQMQAIDIVSPTESKEIKNTSESLRKKPTSSSHKLQSSPVQHDGKVLNVDLATVLALQQERNEVSRRSDRPKRNHHSFAQLNMFTRHTVPSNDFFFDIADLSEKLRNAELSERSKRLREREKEALALAMLAAASPQNTDNVEDLKAETASTDSFDSVKRVTKFNMAYEPPVLFENKGRYLGAKAPKPGSIASTVKTE